MRLGKPYSGIILFLSHWIVFGSKKIELNLQGICKPPGYPEPNSLSLIVSGKNDQFFSKESLVILATILAALTIGYFESALEATVTLSTVGNRDFNLSWYFAASPTVSTNI